ncbi:MAG: acetolactate decarboxylase [Balneolia bacterium]|nr:acetolactate decarboxylase [Balneolia bacterium]
MRFKTRSSAVALSFIIVLGFLFQDTYAQTDVEYYGALRSIMHQGDLSANKDLSDLEGRSNLYALGAFTNLKGEIQIIGGRSFSNRAVNGELQFTEPFEGSATLLVTAEVQKWIEVSLYGETVANMEELQYIVKETASANGIDTSKPFPFLVEGAFAELAWHVIDWPESDDEHTHEKHQTTGPHGVLTDTEVTILGFYSESHQGVFTHHSYDLHLHFLTADEQLAGHVDRLESGQDLIIRLPSD